MTETKNETKRDSIQFRIRLNEFHSISYSIELIPFNFVFDWMNWIKFLIRLVQIRKYLILCGEWPKKNSEFFFFSLSLTLRTLISWPWRLWRSSNLSDRRMQNFHPFLTFFLLKSSAVWRKEIKNSEILSLRRNESRNPFSAPFRPLFGPVASALEGRNEK